MTEVKYYKGYRFTMRTGYTASGSQRFYVKINNGDERAFASREKLKSYLAKAHEVFSKRPDGKQAEGMQLV